MSWRYRPYLISWLIKQIALRGGISLRSDKRSSDETYWTGTIDADVVELRTEPFPVGGFSAKVHPMFVQHFTNS